MGKNDNWRNSDAFVSQKIKVLLVYSKYKSLEKLGMYLGISRSQMYEKYNDPGKLRLCEIRKLEALAERSGIEFLEHKQDTKQSVNAR